MGNALRKHKKPRLEQMPLEIVNKIAEEAGYVAIQRLRVVSYGFHRFVNNIKPHYFLQNIAIHLEARSVKLILTEANSSHTITFSKDNLGTKVSAGGRSVIREANHFDSFFNDLSEVLDRQKPILEEFEIKTIRTIDFFQHFNHHFKSMNDIFVAELQKIVKDHTRSKQLKAKCVRVFGHQKDLRDILALLDSDCLKTIEFFVLSEQNCSKELIALEQWKKAEELSAYVAPRGPVVFNRRDLLPLGGIPITKLAHFVQLCAYCGTITVKELEFLKKSYSQNPNFKSAEILAKARPPRDRIERVRWGRLRNTESFYSTSSSEHVLGHFFSVTRSHFRRIPLSEVPENIEIETLP